MYAIKLKIPQQLIDAAKQKTDNKAYNKLSITKGARNTLGILGELCYVHMMSYMIDAQDIIHSPTKDYDVLVNGIKVDVKTKQRTAPPKANYAASIVAYSKNIQLCDAYEFTSITVSNNNPNEFLDFYYIGGLPKAEFFNKATFMKKGQPEGNNVIIKNGKKQKFAIVEDCYNLDYSKLNHLPENKITIYKSVDEFSLYELKYI